MPPCVYSRQLSTSLSHVTSRSSYLIYPLSSIYSSCQLGVRYAHNEIPSASSKRADLRRRMEEWLSGPGTVFKSHIPRSTNYLTSYDMNGNPISGRGNRRAGKSAESSLSEDANKEDKDADDKTLSGPSRNELRPFPQNPAFISESILSEDLRNEIYRCVIEMGMSVRAVSVLFGVDMRRVGAVIRLVELEKRMVKEGKQLALPYAKAVHEMVPTTPLRKHPQKPVPHESINDLPVHPLTEPQIFYPVSESRHFDRVDAGRVFSAAPALPTKEANEEHNSPEAITRITHHPGNIEKVGKGDNMQQVLQPADVRIPHPHLVALHYDALHDNGNLREINRRFHGRLQAEDAAATARKQRRKEKEEASMTRVSPDGGRFEFRFRDVEASRENTGMNGRGTKAPGSRYGMPSYDRKRGQVKIPTKVDV